MLAGKFRRLACVLPDVADDNAPVHPAFVNRQVADGMQTIEGGENLFFFRQPQPAVVKGRLIKWLVRLKLHRTNGCCRFSSGIRMFKRWLPAGQSVAV